MPRTQSTLDFPIRKTRACRNKSKNVIEETTDSTKRSAVKARNKKEDVSQSPESSSRQERSSSKNNRNVSSGRSLERTPTKRKILPDYDQENCCSPPKASLSPRQPENKENSKKPMSKGVSKKNERENHKAPEGESPSKSNTCRTPLSPLKLNSADLSENINDIVTRSQSPFKSPIKRLSLSNISSPHRSINRLNFQSPSRSPLRRLDFLSSPPKTPLRLGMCSPANSAVTNLQLDSPAKSPLKRLDFGSPRRSPRKFNIEDNSPRRSPRKLPMSPLKFSSPSNLVSKLSLSSPSSSKRNISVGLFKPNVTAYRAMRRSLNTGTPTTLVCREEQINTMQEFLAKHLEKCKPGSLYVSGAPGTGKTACLNSLLDDMEHKHIKKLFLNCMTLKTSASIYGKIVTELGLQLRGTEKENTKLIVKTLSSSKHPILIVLDEIDQLDSKNQEVLYSIFEWPSLKDSKLVLVGIANALDLTDRVLPRLQSRPTFKPQLLHFPPYSKAEIVKIINQRIQQAGLDGIQVIRPSAVQFLAGKIASVAGDVRKALDVCRRAVELCEIQARRQTVLKPVNVSPRKSPRKSPKKPETNLKMVDIPQVMAIFNEVYGSRVISAVQNAPDSFSLQQKLLICCLLLFLRHAKAKDITLGKFHEVYTRVCKKHNIPAMDQSEFLSLCTLLESRGMLQLKRAKEVRSSKVFLRLNPEEAEQALGDRTLLASVLEDKESLGKLCKAENYVKY